MIETALDLFDTLAVVAVGVAILWLGLQSSRAGATVGGPWAARSACSRGWRHWRSPSTDLLMAKAAHVGAQQAGRGEPCRHGEKTAPPPRRPLKPTPEERARAVIARSG